MTREFKVKANEVKFTEDGYASILVEVDIFEAKSLWDIMNEKLFRFALDFAHDYCDDNDIDINELEEPFEDNLSGVVVKYVNEWFDGKESPNWCDFNAHELCRRVEEFIEESKNKFYSVNVSAYMDFPLYVKAKSRSDAELVVENLSTYRIADLIESNSRNFSNFEIDDIFEVDESDTYGDWID